MAKNKLAELVLYISEKSKPDPHFGLTKLNKILFAADFFYYGLTGKSISGEKYHHLQFGPAPKKMPAVLDKLKTDNRAEVEETKIFGRSQKRVLALCGADLSKFSENEISFVDYWIDYFRNYNGTQLSKWTHDLNPWLYTKNKEEIPYHSVFVFDNLPVELDGYIWAKNKLNELRERGYAH